MLPDLSGSTPARNTYSICDLLMLSQSPKSNLSGEKTTILKQLIPIVYDTTVQPPSHPRRRRHRTQEKPKLQNTNAPSQAGTLTETRTNESKMMWKGDSDDEIGS